MSSTAEATVIDGEIIEVEETYTRESPVSLLVLTGLLIAAGVAQVGHLVLATILRVGGGSGAGRRSFKQLRKGPEILVTPVWVRAHDDRSGLPVEVEVLGYVTPNSLLRRDRLRATLRQQRRPDLPPQATRIENLTTGRILVPRPISHRAHLGLALLIQAGIGLVLAAVLAVCFVGALLH
jgi:hypothetical protein